MIDRLEALLSPRRARARIFDRLRAQGRAEIGRHTYAVPTIRTFDYDHATKLTIGSFTSIGPEVTVLLGGNHPTNRVTTFPIRAKLGLDGAGDDGYPSSRGDVHIGNDVWIGHGALILSGVTIGDGAVVGANAVISKSIAPYSIVVGNPQRTVRSRFETGVVERLLAIRWWEWPDAMIKGNVELLSDVLNHHTLDKLEAASRMEFGPR